MLSSLSNLEERVYIERVRLFFGNGIRNVLSALLGGIFIVLILSSAGVPHVELLLWFGFLCVVAAFTVYFETRYKPTERNIEKLNRWVFSRSASGMGIAIFYGTTPFVFHTYLGLQEEMFLFIVLSAITSISIAAYSSMPLYYSTLSLLSMTPLSFSFLLHHDKVHLILALTAFIWQALLLSRAWIVSKSAISAIRLSEQLKDEIKEHEATKKQLHELAMHDVLTGLPNRLLLKENLTSMLALAQRNEQKVIVMFLDLDGFKEINDTYGHEVGDTVLKEVALRLRALMRKYDILARMGGDEFVLAFMNSIDIDVLALRVIETLCAPIKLLDGTKVSVGVSVGISLFSDDAQTPEELIRIADDRMYISKANGKNRYTFL